MIEPIPESPEAASPLAKPKSGFLTSEFVGMLVLGLLAMLCNRFGWTETAEMFAGGAGLTGAAHAVGRPALKGVVAMAFAKLVAPPQGEVKP